MIDKIIGGENGGVAGEGSAFINDYGQYIYGETNKDVRSFIDDEFDRQFPSHIDPGIKEGVKRQYDRSASYIASDCVDAQTIDFRGDDDALNKLMRSLQPGCNEVTAQVILQNQSRNYALALVEQAKTEAAANEGLTIKDEKNNTLKKSGVELEGLIQGAEQAVYDVQTRSESAVSSVIGSFVDKIIEELADKTYQI